MRYPDTSMAANGDRSSWLDTFLKLERTIGERVEEAVTSDAYHDFVAQATRARKRLSGAVEGVPGGVAPSLQPPGRNRRAPSARAGVAPRARARGAHARSRRQGGGAEGRADAAKPPKPRRSPDRASPPIPRSPCRRPPARSAAPDSTASSSGHGSAARNGIRVVAGNAGPKVGASPKDVVWRRGRAQLWRYRGGDVRYAQPILIVFSLVSRSYILDLRPGHSAVEFLVDRGFDVYMLDWGEADERDAENSLETYVDGYLPRAVEAVRRESGCDEVTLAGYCLGGTFATLYASAHGDAPVRNLVLLATPIDFAAMGVDGRPRARRAGRGGRHRRRDRQHPRRHPLQRVLHAGADGRGRPTTRGCSTTSGTTSSSTGGRRWPSGRATTSPSRARRRGRSSSRSSARTRLMSGQRASSAVGRCSSATPAVTSSTRSR